MTRATAPAWEGPVPGETARQVRQRRDRNRFNRQRWQRWQREQSELCRSCGYTRSNVRHEQDPSTAPGGPDYYADMLDALHEFVPSGRYSL